MFEHLIFQQLKAIQEYKKRDWEIKCYRNDYGLEVDFILESREMVQLIEVKYQKKFLPEFEKSLVDFEGLLKTKKKVQKIIVYTGSEKLKTKVNTQVVPYVDFLSSI